jgi:hypothetical protein
MDRPDGDETQPFRRRDTEPTERASVELIEALADVWSAIRRRHPDVPGVVLLPAPAQNGRMNVLGHFAALRWSAKKQYGGHLHEVVVVAEHLDRSAEDITETLLHEAAHAMNHERGKKDCSRSQYHNQAFKAAAEELGLAVIQVRHYGFASTSLPVETAERYAEETAALRAVLVHRTKLGGPIVVPPGTIPIVGVDEGPQSRCRKATCCCPYIIRVSKKTMEDTTIRCESCGQPFQLT